MKFEKYHGLGNDFVITAYEEAVKTGSFSDLAKKVCDRKTGVGADGLIIYSLKEEIPEMIFYNADGSYDTMCGNGFRCLCLYLKKNSLVEGKNLSIKTGAGVLDAKVISENPFQVRVAMGEAEYTHNSITEKLVNQEVAAGDRKFNISARFVGTPHVVTFVDEIDEEFIEKYGPLINELPYFPEGTSVNFCKVEGKAEIRIATWERGVGITMACGTGSCASATVARELGRVEGKIIEVRHKLGELTIETGDEIYMIGGGTKVARGYFEG